MCGTGSIGQMDIPGHESKRSRRRAALMAALGAPIPFGPGAQIPAMANRKIEENLDLAEHGINVFSKDKEDESPGGGGGGPAAPQAESEKPDRTQFDVPEEQAPPTFLGISSSMSPTQQRARLATLGTQGDYGGIPRPREGPYAGMGIADVAQSYYRNIALRSLLDEQGLVRGDASILPVEWEYLERLSGQPRRRETTEHYLTRLTA